MVLVLLHTTCLHLAWSPVVMEGGRWTGSGHVHDSCCRGGRWARTLSEALRGSSALPWNENKNTSGLARVASPGSPCVSLALGVPLGGETGPISITAASELT